MLADPPRITAVPLQTRTYPQAVSRSIHSHQSTLILHFCKIMIITFHNFISRMGDLQSMSHYIDLYNELKYESISGQFMEALCAGWLNSGCFLRAWGLNGLKCFNVVSH